MIKAVLFDFDGLILDTENAEFQSWQEMYREHGHELDLIEWSGCVGRAADDARFDPYSRLEELLGHSIDREEIRARRRERNLEIVHGFSPRPGVLDYLSAAERMGLKLGVVSSGVREWVGGHLQRLELIDRFDTIRCAGDAPRAKPFPDLYLRALDDLGLKNSEAIALEDSPNGVTAAVDAGLFTVWVPNDVTRSLSVYGYDLRLDSLADLDLESLLDDIDEPAAIAL